MKSTEWRRRIQKTTSWHVAEWMPIYLIESTLLRGNLGAYHLGTIWLNEGLEGRYDPQAQEILHHEIFHRKIARARRLEVQLGCISIAEAMILAGRIASEVFPSGSRRQLIEHYRSKAGSDFDEECLVQMCCALMYNEKLNMPKCLHSVCMALCRPFSLRWQFIGGFLGTLPNCLHGVRRWPKGKPLPGGNLSEPPLLTSDWGGRAAKNSQITKL